MSNFRYRDKGNLLDYDLDVELFKRFDLNVYDVIPVRDVFTLKTDKGDKILKKINYSIEELNFIYDAIEYIKRSYNNIVGFYKALDGSIYTLWNNDIYCVMDLIDGRECEISNPVDIEIAAKGIGKLHKASEGFKGKLPYRNMSGKLINNIKRKKEEMGFFKKMVSLYENKCKFDEIFIENVDFYISRIDKCIELLERSQYYKLCSEEDKVVLCHHDLAHHNILIKDDEAYFIDFDSAIMDLKVHDLCNFISKTIKNFAFDVRRAKLIIDNYCTSNSLDERELDVLYSMLNFPEDFYTISKDYYSRRKKWDENTFLYRFKKKVSYKDDMENFLEEFKKELK